MAAIHTSTASAGASYRMDDLAPATSSTRTPARPATALLASPRDVEAQIDAQALSIHDRANRSLMERLLHRDKQEQNDVKNTFLTFVKLHTEINRIFAKDADKPAKEVTAGSRYLPFAHEQMKEISLDLLSKMASAIATVGTMSFASDKLNAGLSTTSDTSTSVPSGTGTVVQSGTTSKASQNNNFLLGVSFGVFTAYDQAISRTLKWYLINAKHDPISAMEENFNRYVAEQFTPKKDDLPSYIHDPAEKIITRIQLLFDMVRPDKNKPTNMSDPALVDTVAFIETARMWLKDMLLERQDSLKTLPGWMDKDGLDGLLRELNQSMKFYKDPYTAAQYRNFVLSYGTRSVELTQYKIPEHMLAHPPKASADLFDDADWKHWHHWHAPEYLPQKNLFVLGIPGTGKGRFLRVMRDMGIPLFSQTYQGMMKGGVSSGDAAKWRAINQRKFLTREGDALGERMFSMFGTKFRNSVRVLDEPNFEDIDGIKRDIDPYVDMLKTECLETMARVNESCTVILTNRVPEVDKIEQPEEMLQRINPAILSRVEVVVTGESDEANIRELAIDAYRALASRHCLPFADGSGPIIPEEHQPRMVEAFRYCLDDLVERHAYKRGDSRLAIAIEGIYMEMFTRLRAELVTDRDGVTEIPPMDKEDIRQWMLKTYAITPYVNPYRPKEKDHRLNEMLDLSGNAGITALEEPAANTGHMLQRVFQRVTQDRPIEDIEQRLVELLLGEEDRAGKAGGSTN
jgi:hypothetical protein